MGMEKESEEWLDFINALNCFMISQQIIGFYKQIMPPSDLPEDIHVLYPQRQENVIATIERFYNKYYQDENTRTLIFGINPGRFGAGVTGINFTAPKQLTENCGIEHCFKLHSELSAEFIYEMIERYGGVEKFYSNFFISSISPLGFIKNKVNVNYYDAKNLQESVTPFIIDCINRQLEWNVNRNTVFCIGGEKNFKFFSQINKRHGWFNKIIPLPHPRFIMQYKRKTKEIYLLKYLDAFSQV